MWIWLYQFLVLSFTFWSKLQDVGHEIVVVGFFFLFFFLLFFFVCYLIFFFIIHMNSLNQAESTSFCFWFVLYIQKSVFILLKDVVKGNATLKGIVL